MKRLNKYILLILALFSMTLSSCSFSSDSTNDKEENVKSEEELKLISQGISYVKLELASASVTPKGSRTALPDFSAESDEEKAARYSGFIEFILQAERGSSAIQKIWTNTVDGEGNVTKTAYQAFVEDSIFPLGYYPQNTSSDEYPGTYPDTIEWKFTLYAYYGGTLPEYGFPTDSVYFESDEVTKNIHPRTTLDGAAKTVQFELTRKGDYKFSSEEEKKGSIGIILNYVANSGVSSVKAKLYKVGETSEQVGTEQTLEDKTSYSATELPEGNYYVDFALYGENELYICTVREYACVINNLESKSTLTVDPNGTFTITYKYKDGSTSKDVDFFAESATVPAKYTRLSGDVTFPVTSAFDSENNFVKDNIFLGWYESKTSATRITDIPAGTRAGNITLYGKFIHKNEQPDCAGVQFKYDESTDATTANFKVGHKLTATPYYNDGTSDKPFLGTIASWKWYYGVGESWTEIPATDVTIDTDASNADSTPASSSIWLKPAYAGKKIKVEVVQKYKIEESATSGIFDATENTSSSVDASETESTVANGTLKVDPDFELGYNYESGKAVPIVRSSTTLDNTKINKPSGYDSKIYDANHTSDKTNWTMAKFTIAPSVEFSTDTAAPTSTAKLAATISATGYDDLTVENCILVTVKYEVPSADDVKALIWKAADGTDVLECINSGKVVFKANKIGELPIVTSISSGNTPSVRTTLAEVANLDNIGSQYNCSGSLNVGFKESGTSGDEGYIAPSDKINVTLSTDCIGTRILIKDIKVPDDITVGKPFTLEALDDSSKATGVKIVTKYNDIVWTFKFGSTNISGGEGVNTTYTINQADYRAATAGGGSNTFSATGVRTYPQIGEQTITLTGKVILKGEMSDKTFTYAGPAKNKGDSVSMNELNPSSLTSNTDKNSGATIECTASVSSTVSSEGTVNVTIKADGYSDKTVTVSGIPIKPSAPEIGGGGGGSSGSGGIALKTGNDLYGVSVGHVAFNSYLTDPYKYEFTRASCANLNTSYNSMKVSQLNAVYITKTGSSEFDDNTQTLISSIATEFAAYGETGWHSIPHEPSGINGEFTSPVATNTTHSLCLSLRTKMVGRYNNEDYYYDSGRNVWHNYDYSSEYVATEFAGDGLSCQVEDGLTISIMAHPSAMANVPYDPLENNGKRGLKNINVEINLTDLKLSSTKADGKVTLKLADNLPKTYTITQWRIDGKSISSFKTDEGISTGIVGVTGTKEAAYLEFTLADLKDGTYQVSAYGKDENGIEYTSGASIVVSN